MLTESLQPVAIFWDIENCAVPHGVKVEEVSGNIRRAFKAHLAMQGTIILFSAYGDFSHLPRHIRQGCQMTGVNLIDIPHGRKDAADKAILADMFLFALDNPPPGIILLISGDVDFAPALHKLGQRGYCVVLAIPTGLRVSPALCNACQHLLSWPDVARGKGGAAVRTSSTCTNSDAKTWKMVVRNAKRDRMDSFKYKHVEKDISNCRALAKHQGDLDKVVAGPENVAKGPSYTHRTFEATRLPDGIFEEEVKVPPQFAKELEAIAVAMGVGNLETHGKVVPFTAQDMHHDQSVAEAGHNVGCTSASKPVEHYRKSNGCDDWNYRCPATRSQTVQNETEQPPLEFRKKKKAKDEKDTSDCRKSKEKGQQKMKRQKLS
ncbi:hypothetical protein L7F22_061041 [Adiantum nelumboides]|nr:hypothetical protein [Adiantum nelumboides]